MIKNFIVVNLLFGVTMGWRQFISHKDDGKVYKLKEGIEIKKFWNEIPQIRTKQPPGYEGATEFQWEPTIKENAWCDEDFPNFCTFTDVDHPENKFSACSKKYIIDAFKVQTKLLISIEIESGGCCPDRAVFQEFQIDGTRMKPTCVALKTNLLTAHGNEEKQRPSKYCRIDEAPKVEEPRETANITDNSEDTATIVKDSEDTAAAIAKDSEDTTTITAASNDDATNTVDSNDTANITADSKEKESSNIRMLFFWIFLALCIVVSALYYYSSVCEDECDDEQDSIDIVNEYGVSYSSTTFENNESKQNIM